MEDNYFKEKKTKNKTKRQDRHRKKEHTQPRHSTIHPNVSHTFLVSLLSGFRPCLSRTFNFFPTTKLVHFFVFGIQSFCKIFLTLTFINLAPGRLSVADDTPCRVALFGRKLSKERPPVSLLPLHDVGCPFTLHSILDRGIRGKCLAGAFVPLKLTLSFHSFIVC